MSGYRALRIADVEAVPWPGGIDWHPIRSVVGWRAFGIGGYSGARAGDVVIEPHVESDDGRAHHELYVVLAGRATFTLDGEQLDAPAGTLVFVSDPTVHRQAVAAEPDTEVLALGGPPEYEPAGSEWQMRARPLMDSDPERARALLEEGWRELPHSAAIPYGFAQLAAAQGDLGDARRWLAMALERAPGLRDEVAGDERLGPLLD